MKTSKNQVQSSPPCVKYLFRFSKIIYARIIWCECQWFSVSLSVSYLFIPISFNLTLE